MAASGGILRDYRGVALAAFGSFLGHQPILYAELMAVCEGLELAARLGHSVLEVESDSATVVLGSLPGSSPMGLFLTSPSGVSPDIFRLHSGETCSSRGYFRSGFLSQLGMLSSI